MPEGLTTTAVVVDKPEHLVLAEMPLDAPTPEDLVVDMEWSGISTGTERLLWSGRMPPFPGMGYPLVPGYESIGRVRSAGSKAGRRAGELVFVPGARCYGAVNGLFGGAASRVVVKGERVLAVPDELGDKGVLLALAATAHHAVAVCDAAPELIVGHGVLGRLLARISIALHGQAPAVWEANETRRAGGDGYPVLAPDEDRRTDYRQIIDASGASDLLDTLIARLAGGGEIVLAGFYEDRLSFAFPPAFMREARLKVAAEWKPVDLEAARDLVAAGRLSLDGLITHHAPATDAAEAYRTAFDDPACLKMVLDWRGMA